MGNRAHNEMFKGKPFSARSYHGNGPPVWLKRNWHHRFRLDVKRLLRLGGDDAVFPVRIGNIYDWY